MTPQELLNEITNGPLATELSSALAAGDDVTIYNALTRKDIDSPGEITSHDVRQYLMLNDLLQTIEVSDTAVCKAATRALEIFPVFKLTIPEVLTKFTAILDGLVNEPLVPAFTATHKAELLALASTKVSRAQQLGISITNKNIIDALYNADGTRRVL